MGIFWYLLFTLIIEIPLVGIFYRKQLGLALLIAFLSNILTWPVFQLLREFISNEDLIPLLEAGIFLIEAVIYFLMLKGKFAKACMVSLFANLLSYGTWLILDKF